MSDENYDSNNKKDLKRTFNDRKRTNILKDAEQQTILFLVARMPGYITPDILTAIGVAGSGLVLASFILGYYIDIHFLLLGISGLAINWFGDSLDGRLAYFRNIPRKWYGFALDVIMDWTSTVLIGMGYMVYADDFYELLAFLFVVLYGWAMIISQLRYKITDQYTIDSGQFGPTEIRVIICLILLAEVLFPGSISTCAMIICVLLFIVNLIDTRQLLKLADEKDLEIKRAKGL